MAFLFCYLGYCVKQNAREIESNKISCWILLGPVVVVISAVNAPVAMYENKYGNILLFFFRCDFWNHICLWALKGA